MINRNIIRSFSTAGLKGVMIAGSKRTPVGMFLGGLSDVPGSQLGAVAAKAAV